MSFNNKTFKNLKTGLTKKVMETNLDKVIFEDLTIDTISNLTNDSIYIEDVSNILNGNPFMSIVDTIKSIDSSNIKDDLDTYDDIQINNIQVDNRFKSANNDNVIIPYSEEDEVSEIAKKYNVNNTYVNELSKQNEAFDRLLNPVDSKVDNVVERNDTIINSHLNNSVINHTEVEDPIITIFKNAKRNVDFNISIDVFNKIPRIDFIEMMEDSYNTSIIQYLADDITNGILKNPDYIRNVVLNEIESMVYNKDNKGVKGGKSAAVVKKAIKTTSVSKNRRSTKIKDVVDNVDSTDSTTDTNDTNDLKLEN